MKKRLNIALAGSAGEVSSLHKQGYVPIGCWVEFGPEVAALGNSQGNVAQEAYGRFGACRADPSFVINCLSLSTAFAINALMGLLPHPSRMDDLADPSLVADGNVMTTDLTPLAKLIDWSETNPLAVPASLMRTGGNTEWESLILLWHGLMGHEQDTLNVHTAVGLLRNLVTVPPSKGMLKAVMEEQRARIAAAGKTKVVPISDVTTFISDPGWQFNNWFIDRPSPVLALFREGTMVVTCSSIAVARKMFGEGAMASVLDRLKLKGWCGRQNLDSIASPLTYPLTEGRAMDIARQVDQLVNRQ